MQFDEMRFPDALPVDSYARRVTGSLEVAERYLADRFWLVGA